MTQNTQTTAERIFNLLAFTHEGSKGSAHDDFREVAPIIAAEIEALTAQRDALVDDRAVANRETDALKAQLAEARAEVDRLRLPAEAWRTLEAYREAERNGTSEEAEGARRVHIPIRDAARARAAKESL